MVNRESAQAAVDGRDCARSIPKTMTNHISGSPMMGKAQDRANLLSPVNFKMNRLMLAQPVAEMGRQMSAPTPQPDVMARTQRKRRPPVGMARDDPHARLQRQP